DHRANATDGRVGYIQCGSVAPAPDIALHANRRELAPMVQERTVRSEGECTRIERSAVAFYRANHDMASVLLGNGAHGRHFGPMNVYCCGMEFTEQVASFRGAQT